jgi:hypothetical protein
MNISNFYRDEADVPGARSNRVTPSGLKKWRELADDYLRLALQFEEAEAPSAGVGAFVPQTVQQQVKLKVTK